MKEQNKTTSEDYLDNLLNSIMNGDSNNQVSDMEELGSIDDSLNDIEDELFGAIEDTDIHIIDDDDYFGKEISDEELFGIDDDILSVIDDAPRVDNANTMQIDDKIDESSNEESVEELGGIHEIIKDDDVEEVINVNDSAADDNLQGLLDVMGISEEVPVKEEKETKASKKEKKKRKLFGGKKKEKVKLEEQSLEEAEEEPFDSDDMMDLSSFAGFVSDNLDNGNTDSTANVENAFSNDDQDSPMDFGSMDFDLNFNDDNSVPEEKPLDEDLFSDDFGPDLDSENEEEKDDNKGKKKKDKKEKKEKKEKKKKSKNAGGKKPSAKKAKPKREKKVKEKEPDEYIKISKIGMILAFTVAFVFIFAVIFGGDYYTYNKRVSTATKEYVAQNYTVAYDALFGLELKKDDDKELFNQIQTVMFVNRHYEAYTSLIRMNEYEQGLYSLLKGVKMFDKYQNTGRELNCYDDMQDVLGWIDKGLLETYGLSESEARAMNLISDDHELAVKVHEIAAEARKKAEAEKEAEEANKDTSEELESAKENENDSNN